MEQETFGSLPTQEWAQKTREAVVSLGFWPPQWPLVLKPGRPAAWLSFDGPRRKLVLSLRWDWLDTVYAQGLAVVRGPEGKPLFGLCARPSLIPRGADACWEMKVALPSCPTVVSSMAGYLVRYAGRQRLAGTPHAAVAQLIAETLRDDLNIEGQQR